MISYPQQRASPILEKAREGSHRGPADEGWAKGAYRNEKQKQDESMLWEAGRGWE